MRHQDRGRKLNRSASHRRAMFSNMAVSLFERERIETTLPKAKELRGVAERLITYAKQGDLHARRLAAERVNDGEVLKKLFTVIGPHFKDRSGGYVRVLKTGERKGDNTLMAIVELVGLGGAETVRKRKKKKKAVEPGAPEAGKTEEKKEQKKEKKGQAKEKAAEPKQKKVKTG
ncbi:MAG: 50S ribosomal protein L17 [Chitinispirillaceae bacterium]|nr:50S ribosomal protein L17 [Chitinispirillaceae bacterium]